jgi:hypothetical protein
VQIFDIPAEIVKKTINDREMDTLPVCTIPIHKTNLKCTWKAKKGLTHNN